MIKSEVITHEGNPGPNWLDHCKALVTPWSVSLFVVAAAVLCIVIAATRSGQVSQAGQQPADVSQQATPKAPLTVTSLKAAPSDSLQPSTTAAVQAATGTANPGTPSNNGATSLGAQSTPNLNTQQNTGSTDPTQINARQLTNGVQSTVTDTVKSVTSGLGL